MKEQNANMNDTIQIFGQPHSKSIKDENTGYILKEQEQEVNVCLETFLLNNVLVLKFDKFGILEEKLFYNKEDMNKYNFAKN